MRVNQDSLERHSKLEWSHSSLSVRQPIPVTGCLHFCIWKESIFGYMRKLTPCMYSMYIRPRTRTACTAHGSRLSKDETTTTFSDGPPVRITVRQKCYPCYVLNSRSSSVARLRSRGRKAVPSHRCQLTYIPTVHRCVHMYSACTYAAAIESEMVNQVAYAVRSTMPAFKVG